jgi:hypothetical protein
MTPENSIEEPLALPLLAVMSQSKSKIDEFLSEACARFGSVLMASNDYDFDAFTKYYAPEFGTGLIKRLIFFAEPREQRLLAEDKLWSNALEQARKNCGIPATACTFASSFRARASETKKRSINVDPGYLTLSKLILASTKDHAQRIYLSHGIWAEITLAYHGRSFVQHPWSYPDYIAQIPFINTVRLELHTRFGGDMSRRLR